MADKASRDTNQVTSLLAVSSVDGKTPVALYANPTSHRLLTDFTGTSYEALSGSILSSVVDLTQIGETLIYTVPTGKKFLGTFVFLEGVTITNMIANPQIGVGTVAGGYGNFVSIAAIPNGLTSSSALVYTAMLSNVAAQSNAGEGIYISVQLGATADVATARVRLLGVLVDA